MHSFFDRSKRLFIDCSECKKGGNGTEIKGCMIGHRIIKPREYGCFTGELLDTITSEEIENGEHRPY